jgi:hypothetical protein
LRFRCSFSFRGPLRGPVAPLVRARCATAIAFVFAAFASSALTVVSVSTVPDFDTQYPTIDVGY